MAKSKAPPKPTGPFQLTESKESFKTIIDARIEAGNAIVAKAKTVQSENELRAVESEFNTWDDFNANYLSSAFTDERQRETYAGMVRSVFPMGTPPLRKQIQDFCEDTQEYVRRLESLLSQISIFRVAAVSTPELSGSTRTIFANSGKVFLVHGHDHNTRSHVKNVVHELELKPIVLDGEANQGKTVIEKFESHSNEASYAIVIATGDDEGYRKNHPEEKKLRARQNVIGEFFYFMAKLGRDKVALLYETGVELPSDIGGFCHIPIDSGGLWKYAIARELKAAGFDVNLNNIKI